MKTVVIVQARMTSTRLPGKVLKEVLGRPLLDYQIERLRCMTMADQIVVATTMMKTDDPIVELCKKLGIAFYRGPEADVLARYYGAAVEFGADTVVRITADCPVIDPVISDKAVRVFLTHRKQYDYISLEGFPRGMDTEVFPFTVLEECWQEAVAEPDREHVTPYIYHHPERYRLKRLLCSTDYSHHRWTVDTLEDFELIRRVIEELYPVKPKFDMEDILTVMNKYPDWYAINAKVRQKGYGE